MSCSCCWPELDLSLPSQPDCIEGVPKGSPDGTRGSQRTFIADGFGPDWNPTR